MREEIFKICDRSLKDRYIPFGSIMNLLIVSDDNKELEYLEEWCNENEVNLLKLDFNDIKFFKMSRPNLSDSNKTAIYSVNYDEINNEPQMLYLNPDKYEKYIKSNEQNALMYLDCGVLKINDYLANKLNNGKVVLVLTGMENHLDNKFDISKRSVILDFIREPKYDSLIFSACIVPRFISDAMYLTSIDGKDQFIIIQ